MTTKEYAEAKRMWRDGTSVKAMAHALGYSAGTIKGMAYHNRQDFPFRKTRLTDEERERMRELRSQGMTYREVAQEVGRSISAVKSALRERKEQRNREEVRYE